MWKEGGLNLRLWCFIAHAVKPKLYDLLLKEVILLEFYVLTFVRDTKGIGGIPRSIKSVNNFDTCKTVHINEAYIVSVTFSFIINLLKITQA